jgi:hypothetical protein
LAWGWGAGFSTFGAAGATGVSGAASAAFISVEALQTGHTVSLFRSSFPHLGQNFIAIGVMFFTKITRWKE